MFLYTGSFYLLTVCQCHCASIFLFNFFSDDRWALKFLKHKFDLSVVISVLFLFDELSEHILSVEVRLFCNRFGCLFQKWFRYTVYKFFGFPIMCENVLLVPSSIKALFIFKVSKLPVFFSNLLTFLELYFLPVTIVSAAFYNSIPTLAFCNSGLYGTCPHLICNFFLA